MNLNNVQSFDSSGIALVAYRWAALNSSAAIIYADKDVSAVPIGTIMHDRAAADVEPIDVSMHNCGGVHFATAAAAILKGAEVELQDDGKIITLSAGPARGVALQAATGDGSVIRVLVYGNVGSLAIPTDVATADGSDPTTTQALANALKVKLNALLLSLR
jgi:hypothetical protein